MARKSDIRREKLIGLAEASGLTSVEELSVRLGVTASTIRRDLARLQDGGRLARTYGGAMAIVAHHETSLPQRAREATGAKRAIARWAARQIVSGETVLLDSGTTTGALARELRSASNLTVVTTGLTTLNQLADVGGGVHLECLGGTFRPASQGFVGPLAETSLERMTFDRVFLGADGVTADHGICEADLAQTQLKELMTKRTECTYVLAHASKLGRRPFHAWASLPDRWTLVTDDSAAVETLEPFRVRGVNVVVVDTDGRAV